VAVSEDGSDVVVRSQVHYTRRTTRCKGAIVDAGRQTFQTRVAVDESRQYKRVAQMDCEVLSYLTTSLRYTISLQ